MFLDAPLSQLSVPPERVAALRRFNRFHTRLVGALAGRMEYSDLSLPQARVLYEVAAAPGRRASAADLARALQADAGYVSRLVSGLERRGLVARRPDPEHGRRRILALTRKGAAVFARLDAASAAEAARLLAPLAEPEQARLTAALDAARRLLGDADSPPDIALREPRPGDLGWIVHRHAALYAQEYGWDASFEALVARIVADFAAEHDPQRERAFVADQCGEIVGSVFVMRADAATAKLRLLYVEPAARGRGLGRSLVDAAMAFARQAGYRRMTLWTNDPLTAARRVYERSGFALVEETPHQSFGKDLVGQVWTRDL